MHRDFYYFGVFFFSLLALITLFQGILFFQIGYHIYQLDSIGNWFWVEVSVSLITVFMLLAYFKHKDYRLVFIVTLIALMVSLLRYTTTYLYIVLMMREMMDYHIAAVFISLALHLFYACSLVFSKAGKNPYLKTEGIAVFILALITTFFVVWSLNLLGMQSNPSVIEKMNQWVILANSLVPLPLILLFYEEQKALPAEEEFKRKYKYTDLLYACGGLLIIIGLVVGIEMSMQARWYTYISPEEQALLEQFETHTYEDKAGNRMDYLFMKPLNYDSTQMYPLVICLHGGPKSVKSKRLVVTEPAPLLADSVNREKYPAFLFVPQGPPGLSWGGIPQVQAIDSLLVSAIQALEEKYAIDQDRRYVTGISMGGYGTWYLLGTRPHMFAAAIPMCGAGNPELAHHMVNVPIWAFHGSEDRNVPVSGSRNMITAIKKAGGDPKYTEFPGVAHHVWPHVQETDGVLDWLFAQQREE